jgi:hypothetical protein
LSAGLRLRRRCPSQIQWGGDKPQRREVGITLDMMGFDCLDAYLARHMTAPEQRLERRLAQHRVFRARRSVSKLLRKEALLVCASRRRRRPS